MALSPSQFKDKIERVKRNADIKLVIESTGAQPVHANAAKGEYTYHAPYRQDDKPSLKISVPLQSFVDYGFKEEYRGDVIELTRLIHGHGDKNAMPFFEAVKWLERFSGASVAPKAIKPAGDQKKPSRDASYEGERFQIVGAKPISTKSHPNNLDYIKARRISLAVASRHLLVITYRDNAAPIDDPLGRQRYAIGIRNDAGGYDLRMPSLTSNFKMSLGPKGVTTYLGDPAAQIGHVFNGQFDFMTLLEMKGEAQPYHPTIVSNSDSLMVKAAQTIKAHPQLQHVKTWHVWEDNDDSGKRSTQAFIGELNKEDTAYDVYTVNHLYEPHKDLNNFWMDAQPQERTALMHKVRGTVPVVQKSYDTSVSAEARRTHDERIKKSPPKLF